MSFVQIQLSGSSTVFCKKFEKITDLIEKLHLGTRILIREIPLIGQLVERRTVV